MVAQNSLRLVPRFSLYVILAVVMRENHERIIQILLSIVELVRDLIVQVPDEDTVLITFGCLYEYFI